MGSKVLSEPNFSNIAGPFQKTQIKKPHRSQFISQNTSQQTPTCTNINLPSQLKQKHEKIVTTEAAKRRKNSKGKTAPSIGRIIIP